MQTSCTRIYINGRFLSQPTTGVQRYAIELIRGWDEMLERGEIDSQHYQLSLLTPLTAKPLQPYRHIPVQPVGRLRGNLWEQLELPFFASGDFLFNPGNIGPLFKSNQGATIHDASVFAVPHSYSRSFRFKYRLVYLVLAKTARVIITVSQFSRNELQRYCHIPADKIIVIPEGSDHITRIEADSSIFDRCQIGNKPYILTVGSYASHKNLSILYRAAEMYSPGELDFICVGADFGRWFKTQPPIITERVKKLGYISDAALKALYQHAAALIFPSFYEGFGLPPLEAMRCGCPVIVSNTSSLPEICGNAALYFDPTQPQDLVEKINLVINDPMIRTEMREKGFTQAGKYTWSMTAYLTWQSLVEYCR
ncbi:MAG: glycosyltransferase family 4 protein [Chloroflexi bacterium]|nr:glycosyltransferase family 4 protein [Chloroflexota bacterium]